MFPAGVWPDIDMPQTSMEVIKGQMVQLRATYSLPGSTDPSDSTVIWNFWTNNTQLVRAEWQFILWLLGSKKCKSGRAIPVTNPESLIRKKKKNLCRGFYFASRAFVHSFV